MINKIMKERISRIVAVFMVAMIIVGQFGDLSLSVDAASTTISGVNDVSTFIVPKTGALTPVYIDDDVTISSGVSFADGYLLIESTSTTHSDDIIGIISDSDPTAYNAISVNNDIVYLGTGSSKKQIGSVDDELDGTGGKDLKINFSTPLPNGGFEESEDNWNFYEEFVKMKGDSDIQLTWDGWFSGTSTVEVEVKKKENPYFNWGYVQPADGSESYLRMEINGKVDKYGTHHGPYVVSSEFEAKKGDKISLNYYAEDTGDDFDVYGYLIDNATGAEQQLFYQRGDSTNGWKDLSTTINLDSSSRYVFKFICGSYDNTGGTIIGSELLIDNVRLLSESVNSTVVSNVARKVAFLSTTQVPRTYSNDRNYKFSVQDGAGDVSTSSTTATVKIDTYPQAPTVGLVTVEGTTDTLRGTWSDREGGESFDVTFNNSKVMDDTNETTNDFSGLSLNTPYTLSVLATNARGESESSSITRYTNAAVPSLTENGADSNSIDLSINNEGNATGTAYRLERSLDQNNWSTIADYTISSSAGETTEYKDTSLESNTTYYYRIKARNGDNIETGYSEVISKITAPAPPNPLNVEVTTDTDDSLDITWTAMPGAVEYDVYRDNAKINENVTEVTRTQTGLNPNTEYAIHVVAKNENDESINGETVTKYSGAAVPTLVLDAATISTVSMTIHNNNNPIGTKYAMERSIDGIQWSLFEDYTVSSDGTADQSYLSVGLEAGTEYSYRIKAVNEEEVESPYSTPVSIVTVPAEVTGLSVIPREGFYDSLTVTWTAPKGAETYDVYRKSESDGNFVQLKSSYAETRVDDSGLSPNTKYTYYIVANNSSGSAEPSEEISRYTYAQVPGINSENVGDTNNLTIDPIGNPEEYSESNPLGTEYFVEYSTDDGETWTGLRDWIKFLTPQHTEVEAGLTYSYRVKARNSNMEETVFSGMASARSNDAPIVSVDTPSENIYRSAMSGYSAIAISGSIIDADSDQVLVSATIDGVTRSTYVDATPEGTGFTLNWDVNADNISESDYAAIEVVTNDFYGGVTSANTSSIIFVDRTAPTMPTINGNTDLTNDSVVTMKVVDGADATAGINYSEYKLSGATTRSWSTSSEAGIDITNEGNTTVHVRTIDNVGNVGAEQTAVVQIDRTAPVGTSFDLYSTSGVIGLTNSRVVNIKNILATGEPHEMQISNSADFLGAAWTPYAEDYDNWSVTAEVGTKTVYIRFRDAQGNVGDSISAEVSYDNIPPVITISNPTRFNAKKGMTVSYTISVDEEAALNGINNGDAAKIELTYMGTFTEEEFNNIVDNIDIVNIDGVTRQLNINLPSEMNGEGTIGVRVLSGAAEDLYGNSSLLTIGNASFVVDALAPNSQDLLFDSDTTIQGGQAVTLVKSSESCEGGFDSDSVRFAPEGYDGVESANSETITSTHGRSTVINAPTNEGDYYLYVMDAAGNISGASVAKLTVKNYGPTLEVSAPSDSYVNAGASVDYIVTFGNDTQTISLSEEDVALITTGTANAYVDINTVPGESLQRKVTLRNLMGEGSVQIAIAKDSARDAYGNPSVATEGSDPIKVDNTPAILTSLVFSSNNVNNSDFAKKSDTLTMEFITNEEIQLATVTIGGESVVPTSNGDGTVWTASHEVAEDTSLVEGEIVSFSIVTKDMADNVSNPITNETSQDDIVTDYTAPIIQISGDTDSLGRYYNGAEVTFNEGTAVITNADTGLVNTIVSGAIVFEKGTYNVVVTDQVGQQTTDSFVIAYDYLVLENEYEELEIGYANGDNEDSVTRDIFITDTGSAGSSITWVSDAVEIGVSGTDGVVDRPEFNETDKTVQLKATISRNGLTKEKVFILNVIKKTDDSSGLAQVTDDADTARINYAYGDDKDHVTEDIELSNEGLLNGSQLSWESDNEEILSVSETAVDGWFDTTVTRPEIGEEDVIVTLTVTSADPLDETKTVTKTVPVTVKAITLTESQKVKADFDLVDITYSEGDDINNVTEDVIFVDAVSNGSTVTWSTDDSPYISNTGVVTRPTELEGSQEVLVVATITNGSASIDKKFTLTVLKAYSALNNLQNDKDALEVGYYEGDDANNVNTHVVLPTYGENGSVITWESSDEVVIETNGTVNRQAEEKVVTLTATLTLEEETDTKDFVLTVKETVDNNFLDQIYEDAEDVRIIYQGTDYNERVTEDVILKNIGSNGSTIEWESSNPTVINSNGEVTRQPVDVDVQLTAYVKMYSEEINYWVNRVVNFEVKVIKDDNMNIGTDFDDIDIVYAEGDSASSVTSTMYLPVVGPTGTTVVWESNNTDYVSDTGRVSRPGPDDQDHLVTLKATLTHPITGVEKVKVFEVVVKKMTDQEAVESAAKKLSADEAFSFDNEGDIWEAVTDDFWSVTSYIYDTQITWVSSDSEVIDLGGETDNNGDIKATITRDLEEDKNVILTATFNRNGATTVKTYLLVVKAENSVKATVREETFDVILQAGQEEQEENLTVLRTTIDAGTENERLIDTVILDPEEVQAQTENVNPEAEEEERTMSLMFAENEAAPAMEHAIEVPATSVEYMADRNMILEVQSPNANIILDEEEMKQVEEQGNDLYFRVVPIEDETDQEVLANQVVASLGNDATPIGTPCMIESNYSGVNTYIVLPFGDVIINDYDGLSVYVNHSDGTKEVVKGEVVYENDQPYGYKFMIDRFSDFQLVEAPVVASSGSSDPDEPEVTTGTKGYEPEEFEDPDEPVIYNNEPLKGTFKPGVIDTSDVTEILVTLKEKEDEESEEIKKKVQNKGYEIVGKPITFDIEVNKGSGLNSASPFNEHVELMIPIDEGQLITTAVRINEDGTIIHIPTEIIVVDGKYYAVINTLVSGDFGLIYNPQSMDDVKGHWAEEDINNLYSRLIINGVSDGIFQPDRDMSRAELSTIMVRGLGLIRGYGEHNYLDVMTSSWYNEYVETATNHNIVTGYIDNNFRPETEATREEAMVMAARVLNIAGYEVTFEDGEKEEILSRFTDSDQLAQYAKDAAAICIKAGIIEGNGNSQLAPKDNISRAEAATIMIRLLRQSELID